MGIVENADIESWMGKETPEEVLEPNLPIIDPHHHLWDLRRSNGMGFRQAVYLCEEISRDISDSGHNIVQTVFAQCGAFYRADGPKEMRCIGETEFVNGIAAMSRSGLYGPTRLCSGIFSTADLRLGAGVEAVLTSHLAASSNFRGIRSAFPSDLNETFLAGFARLEKYDLSYDNWSPDFARLPRLADLANRCPGVTVIVNHLGGRIDPAADADEIKAWRKAIDAVAADGTLFLNAYATTASCSASRSVVMSGLHNHLNGQYGHSHDFHKFSMIFPYFPHNLRIFHKK